MKKTIKILTIATIILSMIFAFVPSNVFAASDKSIKVTGDVAGKTLSLYKIFNLEITTDGDYHYNWYGNSENYFKTVLNKDAVTIYEATEYLRGLTSEEALIAFADGFVANVAANKVGDSITASNTAEEVVFDDLDQGYYLVYDEGAVSIDDVRTPKSVSMLSSLDEDNPTVIEFKADSVTLDKKVNEGNNKVEGTSANIGDIVNYTIDSKVPNLLGYNTYKFVLSDILSEGLDLLNTPENPITVKIGDIDYTGRVTIDTTTEHKLVINFNNLLADFNDENYANVVRGADILVSYSAKINEKALHSDITNNATITYSNNPQDPEGEGTTTTDVVHIYTYEVDLTKVNSNGDALKGAKFQLKEGNTTLTFTQKEDGYYYYDATATNTELVCAEDGTLKVAGLKGDVTYTLEETKAPSKTDGNDADYSKPASTITFTINQNINSNTGVLTSATLVTSNTEYMDIKTSAISVDSNDNTTIAEANIKNAHNGGLPSTGGMGTVIFTVVGITVMVAAAGLLIYRNRKNK